MKIEKNVLKINDFDWNNPNVLSKNRKPSRVHFYPYENESYAMTCDKDKSTRLKLLNGRWDFKWLESPLLVNETMMNDFAEYKEIQVPGNWQYSGYGKHVYTDIWYDFPVDVPYVSINDNETGIYHKTIELNEEPTSLSIRFEGVESAFHLYVNGIEIGYSQGSRYPSEFDITQAVAIGVNHIHVVVYQYCDGSYLEAQDMWWLGGIIRDVYLIERNEVSFDNLILDPDYDMGTQIGYLNTRIKVSGKGKVTCKVYEEDQLIKEMSDISLDGKIQIEHVTPWSSENPKLYTLIFILTDLAGNVMEVVPQRIGFRHIEIIDGVLQLNGQRILLKGVNRHEYSSKSGRCISYDETYRELRVIKQHNMNAIRTSHYPNNPFFYDICNTLGLYVIDEADLESHGLEAVHTDTLLCGDSQYEKIYLDRIERVVERDRNYPCVLLWSLGNESAYGVNFKAMYNWCKRNEPMRPVHYESDFFNESVDVSSSMYSTVGKLYELDTADIKKPHILCEFGHAMGNGPGSLKEYFELVEASKRIQGLFVWEFKDQGVYQRGEDGKERYLFGGEFGEDFHNGNFCMDGMVMANDQPTPSLKEFAKVIENIHVVNWSIGDRSITIKNRFDFLDTSYMEMTYQLFCDYQCVKTVIKAMPLIAPHDTRVLEIPEELFKFDKKDQMFLRLSITFKKPMLGFEDSALLGFEQIIFNKQSLEKILIQEKIQVIEAAEHLVVCGESFELKVSKRDGCIKNYVFNHEELMATGPMVNFFRAYTDNDIKNAEKWHAFHLHAMRMNVYSMAYKVLDTHVEIRVEGRMGARGLNWGCKTNLVYYVSKEGYVRLDWNGHFDGNAPKQLPKIGLQMTVSKALTSVLYAGFGPGECYCDSKENAYQGIHCMKYQDMFFNYLTPQENGNRTGVKWASLSSDRIGLQFASQQMDFSVRDVSDVELNTVKHSADLTRTDFLTVNCDMINSGLGSESCGPDRMNQYKAYTKDFDFQLVFKPFSKSSDEAVTADSLKAYEMGEAKKLMAYEIRKV